MDPVVHFEMPADDRRRISKFYEKVFGWKTKQMGEEMGNYVVVTTAESDENGFPKEVGRINGGFYPKNTERPAQYPSVVISVKNIKESMKKINGAGGKVLGNPLKFHSSVCMSPLLIQKEIESLYCSH